jgi:ATP-dependent Clp protease ATP-binding subunit ClpC
VFERFTERARQVVVLAQDEARGLRHNYIGTEHILLGLLREEQGLAARLLGSLGIEVEAVRAQVASVVGEGDDVATGQIPFTPRAKRVLELSLREALALGHNYIGTEHVLLGLAREGDGVGARILESFGADAELLREEVLAMLGGGASPSRELEPRAVGFDDVDEWRVPSERRAWGDRAAMMPGMLTAAVGFPLGLLVGWLIWG